VLGILTEVLINEYSTVSKSFIALSKLLVEFLVFFQSFTEKMYLHIVCYTAAEIKERNRP